MRVSEELNEILPALAKVKKEMGIVIKGSKNPFFKSSYADLNAHLDTIEPLLEAHGLLLLQPVVNNDDGNSVESIIFHTGSSQFVASSMKLVGGVDMQKLGSAVTYARRYTLGALTGMKADDDDGENSLSRNSKSKNSSYKPKTSAKPKQTASAASRPSFGDRDKSSSDDTVGEDDGL